MIKATGRFLVGLIGNHCKRTEFILSVCLTLAANWIWNGVLPELPYYVFTLIYVICSIIRQYRVDPVGKSVLITGCDSGFGFLLAKNLKSEGCDVIATSINPAGDAAKELASHKIKVKAQSVTLMEMLGCQM